MVRGNFLAIKQKIINEKLPIEIKTATESVK